MRILSNEERFFSGWRSPPRHGSAMHSARRIGNESRRLVMADLLSLVRGGDGRGGGAGFGHGGELLLDGRAKILGRRSPKDPAVDDVRGSGVDPGDARVADVAQ